MGLGTSYLACDAALGETVRFSKIKPDVVALRKPPFTSVRNSAGTVKIAICDARVNLEREARRASTCSRSTRSERLNPAHLLAVEAFVLLAQKRS